MYSLRLVIESICLWVLVEFKTSNEYPYRIFFF